ncbi:hypothetical protein GQR58_028415 [Nymphon striatum]|nr:hypothetical protein GQR58_028415 [Nymphon striatum]
MSIKCSIGFPIFIFFFIFIWKLFNLLYIHYIGHALGKSPDLRNFGKWCVGTGCTSGIGKSYTKSLLYAEAIKFYRPPKMLKAANTIFFLLLNERLGNLQSHPQISFCYVDGLYLITDLLLKAILKENLAAVFFSSIFFMKFACNSLDLYRNYQFLLMELNFTSRRKFHVEFWIMPIRSAVGGRMILSEDLALVPYFLRCTYLYIISINYVLAGTLVVAVSVVHRYLGCGTMFFTRAVKGGR